MKIVVLALLFASCHSIGLRSVQKPEAKPPPAKAEESPPAKAEESPPAKAEESPPARAEEPADIPVEEAEPSALGQEALTKAKTQQILKEIKVRIEDCKSGEREGLLAGLATEDLFGELKDREDAKKCAPKEKKEKKKVLETSPPPVKVNTTQPTTTTTTTTTSCIDNFMDELVDQANVEFKKLDEDKDGCVTGDELTRSLDKQKDAAKDRPQYYWKLKDVKNATKEHAKDMEKQIGDVDKNKNGCIDEEELEKVRFANCDCGASFDMMDHNKDGKISQTEAANYVNEHMTHADLSHDKFLAIFTAADTDKDNFLDTNEFCSAGPQYKGDGNNEK